MNLCTVFIEREKPVCICVCECVKHIQHSVFPVLIKRNYEMAPGKCQQILTLDSCHIFPTKKKTIKKKKKVLCACSFSGGESKAFVLRTEGALAVFTAKYHSGPQGQ